MKKLYLLLGGNMGDIREQFRQAKKNIVSVIGPIIRESGIYQTAPWGNTRQPDFLNQVIIVETNLSPTDTMNCILGIEKKMGRVRTKKNAPRLIDIDILFYGKLTLDEPRLKIPHPHLQNRRFVLTPLNELSPGFKHPVSGKTIHQLLRVCPDTLAVKKN
ncbi:MAG: 2-amino-4-hydroxy-6-hydroxymethyldihydropteridine diphosphokinase [Chitinophagaceae bacterium]|nr:2-amino-4-hydroxy-6-hydroxymethyldihydropteridine diphosphokinase [Chitinophagaceae bacterium]